jgi:arginine decarboxylase
MATTSSRVPNLDHFFSSSAARLDRWRDLNAKAQAWAADARSGKPGGGRAAVEASLAEVRPLEDFFAFPGHRLIRRWPSASRAMTRSEARDWSGA